MVEKNKLLWIVGGIYVLLPILFFKVKTVFIIGLVSIYFLFLISEKNKTKLLVFLYIFSSSLFGISLFNIKFFDIILVLLFLYLLLTRKLAVIFSTDLSLFYFFGVLIIFEFILNRDTLYQGGTSDVILELARYGFAFLAILSFSQKEISTVDKKSLLKFIDFTGSILVIQVLIMSICQSLFGSPSNLSFGPLAVNVFNYEKNGVVQTMAEERVSAFFSDPNKLMVYFFVLLFLKKVIQKKYRLEFSDLIFISGSLMTGSRTAFIVAALYLCTFFMRTFFTNSTALISVFLISAIILFWIFLSIFNISFTDLLNELMKKVLALTGRTKTLDTNSNIQTDDRVIVWKMAENYIRERPLFGNGIASESILLPYPTHNTILQLILDFGIMGPVLFFGGIFQQVFKYMDLISFLILLFIPMCVLDLANYNFIFFALGVAATFNKKELL